MNVRAIKVITAGVVTLIAIVVFGLTFIRSIAYSPENEIELPASAAPVVTAVSSNVGYPSRLIIPSLGIDTHVQQVGIAASGNMVPPSNFTDVGWYKYGAIPGTLGSAVFAGHVDNALALPGVFKQLSEMKVGDDVYVRTEKGNLLRFRVVSSNIYNYKSVPTDVIFNQHDKARIRLITCDGTWVQSDKSYDERLVVTAELVG